MAVGHACIGGDRGANLDHHARQDPVRAVRPLHLGTDGDDGDGGGVVDPFGCLVWDSAEEGLDVGRHLPGGKLRTTRRNPGRMHLAEDWDAHRLQHPHLDRRQLTQRTLGRPGEARRNACRSNRR